MTLGDLLILIALVGLLVAAGLELVRIDRLGRPDDDPLELRHAHRTVVTLRSGETFAGDLFDTGPRSIVLRNAVAITGDQDAPRITVDGELLLLRSEILYLQIPRGPE